MGLTIPEIAMSPSVYTVSHSLQLQQHPRCFLLGFNMPVAAPALSRDTVFNSPVYLTVCPSNLLSLCVGLFGAGCGYTGY